MLRLLTNVRVAIAVIKACLTVGTVAVVITPG